MLFATAAAVALAAGGAGAAFAAAAEPAPVESGYAVVSTSGTAPGEECDRGSAGATQESGL